MKSPESVAKEFVSTLPSGDWDKIATYIEDSDKDIIKKSMQNDEQGEKYAKLILSKATFEVGKASLDGKKATVKVKVTAIDMLRIVNKAMGELFAMAFATAFSEDGQQQDMDAMAEQYFINSMNDPQAPKTTTDVSLNLVKTKDGWKVAKDNDEFFNAITGNLANAFPE